MTRQHLWVILCCLPEKGRKEVEEILEEMKDRNREERGTGKKEEQEFLGKNKKKYYFHMKFAIANFAYRVLVVQPLAVLGQIQQTTADDFFFFP